MNLSSPKLITFWMAVILGVLGILGTLVPTIGLGSLAGWHLVIGFIVLALGNLLEGL
jgi:threonine/homoserine/homoserine lactone efflux protein